jgi:hypothetical protein
MLDMSTEFETLELVARHYGKVAEAYHDLKALLVGRSAKIMSDYNGQPYGSSKPSMKGQIKSITDVHLDAHSGVSVLLVGCQLYIPLDQIKLV